MLLGLLRDPSGPAGRLFARVNLSYDDALAEIRARTGVGDRVATSVELPFGDEVKGALGHAAEESDRLRHGYIGTEHLLLGLLLTEESDASAVLRHHGMEVETVRREIVGRRADGDLEDHQVEPGGAKSAEVYLSYESRVRAENVRRVQLLVAQLEALTRGRAEAQALIERIQIELAALARTDDEGPWAEGKGADDPDQSGR
jgi:ATP-dependent Clp protease ATP-binding subunit ClpA